MPESPETRDAEEAQPQAGSPHNEGFEEGRGRSSDGLGAESRTTAEQGSEDSADTAPGAERAGNGPADSGEAVPGTGENSGELSDTGPMTAVDLANVDLPDVPLAPRPDQIEPAVPPQARTAPPPPERDRQVEAIEAVWDDAATKKKLKKEKREAKAKVAPPRQDKARRPAVALPAMILLALVMAFFAWMSAPATLMLLGFGQSESVSITDCSEAFAPSCDARTASVDTAEEAGATLRVIGDATADDAGTDVTAERVGETVYVGETSGLLWRALLPLGLFAVTTLLFVYASGAGRLYDKRTAARLSCVAFAGALWVGILGASATAALA
ncbi:hypothetical protein [Salininema proteolyticum]|uniref:Uncharacterized protein n=1 Tax=Salininema proteolyticum TaxID=1607685 RepID=A0ABV8U0F3_9ACTN